ncbi:MAG: TerC family protein [Opitutaceae bacterium]
MTSDYHAGRFAARVDGRLVATPLLVVLVAIETADLAFAVDSVPAVLAITREPFIVYTSNVFAVLGLRSMFFALAGILRLFCFLHYGLAAVLVFVGLKMILSNVYHVPTIASLLVIFVILSLSILASLARSRQRKESTSGREQLESIPTSNSAVEDRDVLRQT